MLKSSKTYVHEITDDNFGDFICIVREDDANKGCLEIVDESGVGFNLSPSEAQDLITALQSTIREIEEDERRGNQAGRDAGSSGDEGKEAESSDGADS